MLRRLEAHPQPQQAYSAAMTGQGLTQQAPITLEVPARPAALQRCQGKVSKLYFHKDFVDRVPWGGPLQAFLQAQVQLWQHGLTVHPASQILSIGMLHT